MDKHPTLSDEMGPFVRAHIEALQRHPWLQGCRVLFIGERNIGVIGAIMNSFDGLRNVIPLRQTAGKDWGFWTDPYNKVKMSYEGARLLQEGRVCFLDSLVCSNPLRLEGAPPMRTSFPQTVLEAREDFVQRVPLDRLRLETKREFFQQLRRYRFLGSLSKTQAGSGAGNPKLIVSGKVDDAGQRHKGWDDDMVISFCMGEYIWLLLERRMLPGVDYADLWQSA
jgi:hypothetical protein